jgi:hypothetical protein
MVITATPAAAPPAMAPVFELLPVGSGVDDPVEDGCKDVAVVDTLEGPMSEPGRTSGVSIKKRWSEIITREKTGGMTLTTGSIRFAGVPIVLVLDCVVITVLQRKI